jgi:hypothetical protein
MAEAGLITTFRDPGWRSLDQWEIESPPGRTRIEELLARIRLRICSKRGVLNAYSRHMDRLITNARLPYAAKAPPAPKDPITQLACCIFDKTRWLSALKETHSDLLLLTIALRAYRLDHGRYPDTLAELAPAYLESIPDDPLSLRKPFHYRKTRSKYLLYSIGPDGKDDGGKAVANPRQTNPVARLYVEEISKGDIVAGVNIY